MVEPSTVVLWGGQPETEAVLKAVFEPRGYKISRLCASAIGDKSLQFDLSAAENEASPPQLVVVDHDDATVPPCDHWSDVPRIIIGKMKSRGTGIQCDGRHKSFSHPFQYGELIQAIESML